MRTLSIEPSCGWNLALVLVESSMVMPSPGGFTATTPSLMILRPPIAAPVALVVGRHDA